MATRRAMRRKGRRRCEIGGGHLMLRTRRAQLLDGGMEIRSSGVGSTKHLS
jgi:hypothetical protein